MAARSFAARIVSVDALPGDASLLTLSCPPGIAAQAKPGQFVQLLCRNRWSYDPYLRQSTLLFGASSREETLTLAVQTRDRGGRWLSDRRPGDVLDVSGPTGNGFTIGPTTRNLLLVASNNQVASLVMLATTAVQRGLNVTFLMGADGEPDLLSPAYLPKGVEIVVATRDGSRGYAGDVIDLIPDYARWADQIFVQGGSTVSRTMKSTLQPLRIAGKPSLQVAIDREMPCGFGVCHGCTVATRRGTVLACVRGPVFDADELV